MNDLYTFVYRGVLTDESLDKAGRKTRASFGPAEGEHIRRALSFDLLDAERLANAERMAMIYTAMVWLEKERIREKPRATIR